MGRKESPVWAHVERLSAGKNPRVKCLQTGCGHVFTGNATRIEAHFMGEGSDVKKCSDPPQDLVEILTGARQEKQRQEAEKRQREQDAKEAEEAASTAKAARAAQGTDAAAAVRSNQASSSRAANTQIGRAFARGNRAVADEKLMDLIIKRGLPLSVGEGSELQEFVDAVQKCPGYKVPSRPTISGRLLDEAVMRTDASMAPFHTCTQKYGCGVVLDGWRVRESWQWWDSHGRRVRELQDFARRVLSLVSSSSACERLWSVYGFIKSARRNRLTAERADKLVYCYANMRLAGRISGEEPFEDWADMD